ncbi:TATA box-binding protein-associated factor RNA polymerase I subunit B-like [Scylla paramamosain]|uniref:TATA box-binding protein-associated factor RNA polymerase I subunit B-like n=1 Tax=Scylla paramamosain TaxID=85552 RepID=UPI003082CF92
MPEVKQQCRVCGGESFTMAHGMKVCDQCGQQEEHFVELLSQENIGEVERSRLLTTRLQEPEDEGAAHPPTSREKKLNNWTTYEAYNIILYEWTKALCKLGASPKVEAITFKLWVAYLQRIGIAFSQARQSFPLSSLKNNRDKKLIYEKAESVSSRSLHSYSRRRKKKKAARTKLDKIKDRIESKKIRNAVNNKQNSSFMNTTLASELSKSLNEFEASMVSDSGTSCTPSQAAESKLNTSSVGTGLISTVDGRSHYGALESELEMETDDVPQVPRKQIRRDDVVRNWIKRSTHIYGSDSEGEQYQKNGEEKDESERMEQDCCSDDYHSFETVSTKSRKSQPQNTRKKKRVRSLKSKKVNYNILYKKAVQAANEVSVYRASRLPFIMRFSKLLGILYLAVLLAEDDILLSDIIRWCREGHIPYFSAPYLLQSDMELGYYDLIMLRDSKKLPDAQEVQAITGRLAAFLSIQYVPLPPVGRVMRKFVKLLNLPDQVVTIAESLIGLVDDTQVGLVIPPVESLAMASIILTLKVYCGLDTNTEVMLSCAAAAIRAKMPHHTSVIPFSWQDWQKHISCLVWVCCQVDAPTAFHWQRLHDMCYFSASLFTRFFWREGMWRIPRTSWAKKVELQAFTEKLLQQQGLSLEEVIMQPPLFPASRQPLRSIIDQLTQRNGATEAEIHKYTKVAEELTEESFATHKLNWFCEMECFVKELQRCGMKTEMMLFNEKKRGGILCCFQTANYDAGGRNDNGTNTTQEFFIPNPLKNVWKVKQKETSSRAGWDKVLPTLPSSFQWLVGVGSHICEAPEVQLLSLVCLLQKKVKKIG